MENWQLETPVVCTVFNRPDKAKQIFQIIRQVEPSILFVIADGPRLERTDELDLCAKTQHIFDDIDWPCEVIKNYSDCNLGCRKRTVTGLNWVFEQVEEAIIIEDDCLPDPSFFLFCSELLQRYKDDERVMDISGYNYLNQWKPEQQSYYFSYLYGSSWGWATWRRAWQYYQDDIALLKGQETRQELIQLVGEEEVSSFLERLDLPSEEIESLLHLRWVVSKLLKGGMSIISSASLTTNTGFGKDATNTKQSNLITFNNQPVHEMKFPVKHPELVEIDSEFERQNKLWLEGKPTAEALFPLILSLLQSGHNINALILLENSIKQAPKWADLYYYKAVALTKLRNKTKARETLEYLLNNVTSEHESAKNLLQHIMIS